MTAKPKYLLIVTTPRQVLDTPKNKGAKLHRQEEEGAQLYASQLLKVEGGLFACLIPKNEKKPEWVRVAEADGSRSYADLYDIEGIDHGLAVVNQLGAIVNQLHEINEAIQAIALFMQMPEAKNDTLKQIAARVEEIAASSRVIGKQEF